MGRIFQWKWSVSQYSNQSSWFQEVREQNQITYIQYSKIRFQIDGMFGFTVHSFGYRMHLIIGGTHMYVLIYALAKGHFHNDIQFPCDYTLKVVALLKEYMNMVTYNDNGHALRYIPHYFLTNCLHQ